MKDYGKMDYFTVRVLSRRLSISMKAVGKRGSLTVRALMNGKMGGLMLVNMLMGRSRAMALISI